MRFSFSILFFFTAPASSPLYTLSLHDALPISHVPPAVLYYRSVLMPRPAILVHSARSDPSHSLPVLEAGGTWDCWFGPKNAFPVDGSSSPPTLIRVFRATISPLASTMTSR